MKAQALFGLSGLDEISHSLWWSLLANIGCYVAVSLNSRPDAVQAGQAERFVDIFRHAERDSDARLWRGKASVEALVGLLERFLGPARARQQLTGYAQLRGASNWQSLPADAEFVRFAEAELAGAIGSASARVMVASVAQEEDLGLEEVLVTFSMRQRRFAHTARNWKPSSRRWKQQRTNYARQTVASASWTA